MRYFGGGKGRRSTATVYYCLWRIRYVGWQTANHTLYHTIKGSEHQNWVESPAGNPYPEYLIEFS